MTEISGRDEAEVLNKVFGGLRAEYFRDDLFDLFTQPTYWPELLGRRPCLLIGGRGTGKTTVLRGLSYEGQDRLSHTPWKDRNFVGLYWRVDTSVMAAFRSTTVSDHNWVRLFAHYVNLVLVQLVAEFMVWHNARTSTIATLDRAHLRRACDSLMIPRVSDAAELVEAVEDALVEFESAINNIDGTEMPKVSILGRPVEHLIKAIEGDPGLGTKTFFFLIDEYENLEDYQQRVLNTLIKHSGDHAYTFKIGMRETGHRERSTINPDEQLIEPADYAYINIAERLREKGFSEFARAVCDGRLQRLAEDMPVMLGIKKLLPDLGEDAEAAKLGIHDRLDEVRAQLKREGASEAELASFAELEPLSAFLVRYWSDSKSESLVATLRGALSEPHKWETRVSNYQHAMLYTLRRGRRGIRKYYSGWTTYTHLADGNIRYLLQLVHESLQGHLRLDRLLSEAVAPETQTQAAQAVGGRIVEQLQGVSAQGADLTRLVLGLGRVFQVMASQPEGHTPEVSQFRVAFRAGEEDGEEVEQLLRSAVMHLAVRRFPTDKMAAVSGETKDYSYQLHPIFAPFFVYSYRSKRRLDLRVEDVSGLVKDPNPTIRGLLVKSKRHVDESLPEQLSLFREYFGESV